MERVPPERSPRSGEVFATVARLVHPLAAALLARGEWLDALVYRCLVRRAKTPAVTNAHPDAIHFFVGSLELGGTQRQLIALTRYLVGNGYRCKVWLQSDGGLLAQELQDAGAEWECVFRSPSSPRSSALLFHLWRLFRYHSHVWPALALATRLRQERPVVLQCLLDQTNVTGALAGHMAGVPVVVAGLRSVHPEDWNTDMSRFHRRCYRLLEPDLVDAIIANSERGRASFLLRQPRMPPSKVRVVRNGIEPPLALTPLAEIRNGLGIAPDIPIVMWCGRIVREKRLDLLISACAALVRADRPFQAILVGEGPDRATVQMLVVELGLEDRVRFLGYRADVPDLLRIARLVVLTSEIEGSPNILLEAQLAGCPVVATRAGGVAESIEDGTTGLLHELGDHAGVAASMTMLLDDLAMAERMGQAGTQRVHRLFSTQRMGEETLATYRELAALRVVRLGKTSDDLK